MVGTGGPDRRDESRCFRAVGIFRLQALDGSLDLADGDDADFGPLFSGKISSQLAPYSGGQRVVRNKAEHCIAAARKVSGRIRNEIPHGSLRFNAHPPHPARWAALPGEDVTAVFLKEREVTEEDKQLGNEFLHLPVVVGFMSVISVNHKPQGRIVPPESKKPLTDLRLQRGWGCARV